MAGKNDPVFPSMKSDERSHQRSDIDGEGEGILPARFPKRKRKEEQQSR